MSSIKTAIALSWFTIVYNLLEGMVSIGFGISDDSIALAGFGVDSLIEVASAILILWRFRSEAGLNAQISLEKERRATLGIGILFLLLALGTIAASAFQLRALSHPATTWPGLIIALISLSFMVWLWKAKQKVAAELNSAAMQMDAQCSLACIKLSSVLFSGSVLFVLVPSLWWADAIAAILIGMLIGKEGWETIRAARDPRFSGGCGCGGSC